VITPAKYIEKGISIGTLLLNDIAYFAKLKKIPALNVGGKTMLAYHGIDELDCRDFNSKFISKQRIYKQLKWLKENTHVISVKDYFNNNLDKSKHTICLTFDDGFLNNYTYLIPIINELKIPVSIFVTTIQMHHRNYLWTDFLDLSSLKSPMSIEIGNQRFYKKKGTYFNANGASLKQLMREMSTEQKQIVLDVLKPYSYFLADKKYDNYWKLMDEHQIGEIGKNPFVTIGSHGSRHNNLGIIPLEEAVVELIESKKYLENSLQKNVDSIAFPDGSYSRELIDASEKIGYRYQLACDYLFPFDLKDARIENRLGINPFISWNNQLRAINRGKY
jgi:peptidoglycan/xylan/chitin deacetylase (PgdA/CDA1 family)